MTNKNKTSDQPAGPTEQVGRIRSLLVQNKAAALGLAVLLATGSVLSGCGAQEKDLATAGWEVQEEETQQDANAGNNNNYFSGGGYFLRTGRPLFSSPGKVSWSKPFSTYTAGGYGAIHGGSAVS